MAIATGMKIKQAITTAKNHRQKWSGFCIGGGDIARRAARPRQNASNPTVMPVKMPSTAPATTPMKMFSGQLGRIGRSGTVAGSIISPRWPGGSAQ